jgi:hypothetical protein
MPRNDECRLLARSGRRRFVIHTRMTTVREKLKGAIVSLLVLASCSAPPGVPDIAAFEFGKESQWKWQRAVGQACVDWSATEDYASVYLYPLQCEIGPNVWYLTGSDHLVFNGYRPTPPDRSGGQACDIVVSPVQIGELRHLVERALAQELTDAERRVLRRVDERLAAANGAALTSSWAGCSDLNPEDYQQRRVRENAWRDRS